MTDLPTTDICYRCGYDLHTIVDQQPCPECGLLAERSRRVNDELRYSRPRWLGRISWGLRLILLSIVLATLWLIFANELDQLRWSAQKPDASALAKLLAQIPDGIFIFFGPFVAVALLFCGLVLVTGPERHSPAHRADRARRIVIRVCALGPVAFVIVLWGITFGRYNGRHLDTPVILTILAIAYAICVSLPLPLFYQLRWLANRARSIHLMEHCAIVGIGATISLACFGALIAYAQYLRTSRSTKPNWMDGDAGIVIFIAVMMLLAIFDLWSLYLLVRFSIAFARVSRQLRMQWQRDDRSLPAT